MLTALGKALRMFRIEKGLLLKDMAEYMGVKPSYISSIENGKRKPSRNFVEAACEALMLNEREQIVVEDSYRITVEEVSIKLNTCNHEQLDLGLALARSFDTLTDDQVEAIRAIIKKKEE